MSLSNQEFLTQLAGLFQKSASAAAAAKASVAEGKQPESKSKKLGTKDEWKAKLGRPDDAGGSVYITTKRYSYGGPVKEDDDGDVQMGETGDAPASALWPCFIRATDGKDNKQSKVKISTVIQPKDYDSFMTSYSTVLRTPLVSMLRPKRKKRKDGKDASAGKKKKGGAAVATAREAAGDSKKKDGRPRLPHVSGPRRGAGVEKRRRLMRARMRALRKHWRNQRREQLAKRRREKEERASKRT